MGRGKFEGVIDAVRYETEGKIALVSAYERRGAVWSDRVLLDRKDLVERLKKGKRFVTGQRKEYVGGVFQTGKAVRLVQGSVVADGQEAKQDCLPDIPIF